jgi:hypothetical protein
MKKKKRIKSWRNASLLIAVVVVLVIGALLILYLNQEEEELDSVENCDEFYLEIMKGMADANYCQRDEDCKIKSVWFCHSIVNKNADLSEVNKNIRRYERYCSKLTVLCAEPPEQEDVKCLSNLCTDTRYRES